MSDLEGVRALLFDVFGTVVDWRTSVARELAASLGPLGRAYDWPALADGWRARYQPAMEEIRQGRRPFVKLDVLHHENLLSLLAQHQIEGLDAAAVDHLNRAWHRLDPWPDAVPGLTRLKARFVLAAHSNGNIALLVDMAKRAHLPWDVILGAEVVGAYKPQPGAYVRAARALDLEPGECLMVAAHNGDLEAARGVGMRTAFVARPHEHGPGQTTDLAPDPGVDVNAADLVDLADQLGC